MAVTELSVVGTELERVRTKVPQLYDYDDFFYSELEKRETEVVSSREMRIPLDIRTGGYFGYYDPNDGDMGVGDGPMWDKGVLSPVHIKIGIQWTLQSEYSTDNSRKAVINLFRKLLAKAMPEFRRQSDNQCMTPGNGVLGTITTIAGGGTEFVLKTDGFGVRLLRPGQRIQIYDATLTTLRAGGPHKITFYDLPTAKIRVGVAVAGVLAGDVIVPEGFTAGAVMLGVPYHVSTSTVGNWLGLPRATTPEILSNGVDAAGAALALAMPRFAVNLIGDRMGANTRAGLKAWLHPAQVQAYESLAQLVSIIQKQPKQEPADLYFQMMQMAGIQMKENYSWDKKRIDFLKMDNWGRAELKPAGFYDVEGVRIFPLYGASGGLRASKIFYLNASWNMFCDNPGQQAFIYNLKVPTGYIPV